MSGIEVAGLLVGAFPLVVSALDHYHEANKAIFRFESEYRKTLEEVKDEQLFFRLVLDQLLSPLSAGDNFCNGELEELLESPNAASVAEDRLGHTYGRFMEITKTLHTTICRLLVMLVVDKPQLQARIREELGSNPNSVGSSSSQQKLSITAFQAFMKKQLQYRKEQIELGFGKPQREELISQIHRDNKKTQKLLDHSERIASLRTSRTTTVPPKAVKALLQYWHHADRIYALVSESWECTCRGQHCARLWLQHRDSPVFEFKFLVLWAPHEHPKPQLPPWDRQGLRVTLLRSDVPKPVSQASVCLPSGRSNLSSASIALPAQGTTASQKRRRVGFIDLQWRLKPDPPRPMTTPDTGKTVLAASGTPTAPSDISKLCETMSSCGMQAGLLGSMGNETGGDMYSVHSDPEQKIAADGTSLHRILHGASAIRPKRYVRFQIALAVASSHLQLRSTPWARKQWEASDIFFPTTGDTTIPYMFDRPYVSAAFEDDIAKSAQTPKKADRSFGCLGIMLLELLFGSSIGDHDMWQTPGFNTAQHSPLFRVMVARLWADSVEGEAGPDFSAAVMWCLNDSPMTLDGDQWRKDLASRVVLPLQKCCTFFEASPAK